MKSDREWALAAIMVLLATTIVHAAEPLDHQAIGAMIGATATVQADGVVRVGWSRDDVAVTIDGMDFPPAAGLGSWAAFKATPDGDVVVAGDTVVFEDEITPAMDAAFARGLEVTALHNHFTFDRPPVYFMHIGGRAGDEETLAEGVKAMWDAIRAVRREHPRPKGRFPGKIPEITGEHDGESLEDILGVEGSRNGPVLKFTFGRSASMHGIDAGASMGVATWAAFSGNRDRAVVDGDFAMLAAEMQPVMRALREAGIHIVALHNHMVDESPPYYFLHYWGKGDPETLARGIRKALEVQRCPKTD